ncbi:hypothetical protein EMCRGX_G025648 [Ephydatia muelleri]
MSNRCNIERLQNDAPRGSTSESSRMTLPMNPPAPAVPRPPTIPPPPHQLQGSLDRIMATMNAIQAEQKRQSDTLEEFLQSSYSIEKSRYKRKYCRTVLTSKHNTYKGFQQWLNMNYTTGKPSDEELAAALQEEDSIVGPAEYSHLSPLPEDVHGHIVRGDRCLKDYGFRLSQARVDSAEEADHASFCPTCIPRVPAIAVHEIEQRGLADVGLYRVPGTAGLPSLRGTSNLNTSGGT